MANVNPGAIVVHSVREALYKPGMMQEIVRAVKAQDRAERMITLALNMVKKSSGLMRCEPRSIVGSIIEAIQLNLELDKNLGQAYLVPFKGVCQLIIGYKGFIALANNSSLISRINAEVRRVSDDFQMQLGTDRRLYHKPNLEAEGRDKEGNWLGAYASILYRDGTVDFEYMTAEEIDAIRKRSPAARKNEGPWVTDTIQMWRKTPIRQLAKRIPQSPENLNLVHAAVVDENRELGIPGRHKVDAMPAPEEFEEFLPEEGADATTEAQPEKPPPNIRRKSETMKNVTPKADSAKTPKGDPSHGTRNAAEQKTPPEDRKQDAKPASSEAMPEGLTKNQVLDVMTVMQDRRINQMGLRRALDKIGHKKDLPSLDPSKLKMLHAELEALGR